MSVISKLSTYFHFTKKPPPTTKELLSHYSKVRYTGSSDQVYIETDDMPIYLFSTGYETKVSEIAKTYGLSISYVKKLTEEKKLERLIKYSNILKKEISNYRFSNPDKILIIFLKYSGLFFYQGIDMKAFYQLVKQLSSHNVKLCPEEIALGLLKKDLNIKEFLEKRKVFTTNLKKYSVSDAQKIAEFIIIRKDKNSSEKVIGKDNGLSRSLIFSKDGDCYCLFNKKTDKKVSSGGFKQAQIAIDVSNGEEVIRLVQSVDTFPSYRFALRELDFSFLLREEKESSSSLSKSILCVHEEPSEKNKIVKQTIIMRKFDGDLINLLKKDNDSLTAKQREKMSISLLKQVAFLHSKKIIHNDIKPQNFLYRQESKHNIIVTITDMGLSCFEDEAKDFKESGTYIYLPPEINNYKDLPQNYPYSTKDVWGLGLTLAYLNLDDLSIENQEITEAFYKKGFSPLREELYLPEDTTSKEYAICMMLRQNFKERISVEKALEIFSPPPIVNDPIAAG
jgi:hypothetical protein